MIDKLGKVNYKDILERAFKTFLQGFIGSIYFTDTSLKSILVGAVAGGLSALMNFIVELLNKGENENE